MCLSGLLFVLLLALCNGWIGAHRSELHKISEIYAYKIISVFVTV